MSIEVSKEVLDVVNRTQDEWVMELVAKHCSADYKNKETLNGFDLVFLQDQFKLKIEREGKLINVFVDGELTGQWSDDCEFILEDINSKWKVKSWIK